MSKQQELEQAIYAALTTAMAYGTVEGAHHKMWVIDQMVRALTGCLVVTEKPRDEEGISHQLTNLGESAEYRAFVIENGEWNEGIAP